MEEKKKGKVLVIDDNEDILFALNLLLKPLVEDIRVAKNPEQIDRFCDLIHPDVVLLDMNFKRDAISGEEGFEWLEHILHRDAQAVVILMTAYADADKAVRALKSGATDFITKPWDNSKLLATLFAGIELSRETPHFLYLGLHNLAYLMQMSMTWHELCKRVDDSNYRFAELFMFHACGNP